jgi:hypothetical protein
MDPAPESKKLTITMALRSASVFNPAFLDSLALGMPDDRALMKRYIENKEITIRKHIFRSRFREQILFKSTKIVLLKENRISHY